MKFIDLHCDTPGRIFYENLDLKNQLCKVNYKNVIRVFEETLK